MANRKWGRGKILLRKVNDEKGGKVCLEGKYLQKEWKGEEGVMKRNQKYFVCW